LNQLSLPVSTSTFTDSDGDDNIYDVETILDHIRVKGRRENYTKWYLVKWLGFDDTENSWVKESDMMCDSKKIDGAL